MKELPFKRDPADRPALPRWLRIVLIVPPIGLVFASFVPTYFVSMALAELLDIPDGAPVKDQPNGLLWLGLLFVSMYAFMAIGFVLGTLLDAAFLRFSLGWPWSRIRAADPSLERVLRRLERWVPGVSNNRTGELDPLYDRQLDIPSWTSSYPNGRDA